MEPFKPFAVASRVVVLRFQEELEKRRQQVAAMPTPEHKLQPVPEPVLGPPTSHETWLANTTMGSLRQQAANPPTAEIEQYIKTKLAGQLPPPVLTTMGGIPSREEIYSRLRRDFLENSYQEYLRQQGQTATPNQFLGPQVPPPSPPGIGDYISQVPGAEPALRGYNWASQQVIGRLSPEMGNYLGPDVAGLGLVGRLTASPSQAGQAYQEHAANLGSVSMLAQQAILDTFAGYGLGKGLGLARAGGTSLAKTVAPEARAAAERLYPTVREAVGGEAGGLKLPFGKKAAETEAKAGPRMLPLTEPVGGPAEQKMLGMIERANKAKPEYAAKLTAKRKGVAGEIAAIREQERAGAITRGQATAKIAAARKGMIEAKYEFPEELVPNRAEVKELRTKITAADLKPQDYQNTHDAFNTLLCGQHLQPHEIKYLESVFGPQVGEAIRVMQADPLLKQLWREAIDAANIPRTVFASYDISFPMRQGGLMIGEGAWWRSWKPMLKSLREVDAVRYYEEIMADPMWESLGKTSGLPVAEPTGKGAAAATQEQFLFRDTLVRRAMRKVPGIAPSQQAYTTFGNKLRWDTFKKYITGWDKAGLKYTPEDVKRLANVISIFSGWGKIGALERVLPEISQGIFSPRFWASRIEAVPYGVYLAARSPRLYGPMVARNLGTFIAGNMALAGLAKVSGVFDMEIDPRSTDWMRARIGNLRLDFTAGEGKVFRYFTQLATKTGKSASTGEFYPLNRMKTTLRDIQGHLSPQGSIFADIWTGTTFMGEPVTLSGESLKSEFWNKMAPGFIQDTVDAIREFGPIGALAAIPAATGVTTMTYATPWEKMEAAKDEVAKARFGMDFKALADKKGTPWANELIADDPKVAAAQAEIDKRKAWYDEPRRTMTDIRTEYAVEQKTDDDRVAADPAYWPTWVANFQERQKLLAGAFTEHMKEHPDTAEYFEKEAAKIEDPFNLPADASPDTVRSAYYKLFTPYKGETGFISAEEWDKLGPEIDRFLLTLTPDQQVGLDENLGAGKSETVKEYRGYQKELQPFWDLAENLWAEWTEGYPLHNMTYQQYVDSTLADLRAINKGREWLPRDRNILGFNKYSSAQRTRFLSENPDVEAVLVKLGYNEVFHTGEAGGIYHEETGLEPRYPVESGGARQPRQPRQPR